MVLTGRDGAEFCSRLGARKKRGLAPATDEGRRRGQNSARRFAVALIRPPGVVATLARATSPRCALLLADERIKTITTGRNHVGTL